MKNNVFLVALFYFTLYCSFNSKSQIFALKPNADAIKIDSIVGNKLNLDSLKGKIVYLDFWSSWCVPCRREHRKLVKIYDKYKNKKFLRNGKNGFTVYSISLDKYEEQWRKAIKKDRLKWENHLRLENTWENKILKYFRIYIIPFAYLIDGNGKIIKVGHVKELDKDLEKLLFFVVK